MFSTGSRLNRASFLYEEKLKFLNFSIYRSDPILEPMLQSVPDPFDSYGPPQAEDQIFSILAPLSIMTHAHPPSPSPVTGTSMESTVSHDKITSWLPKTNNGDVFSSEATEWAGSPESTPPRSASPPVSSRRQSNPPTTGLRKAETKLRGVLSVIDEYHPQYSSDDTASGSTTLHPDTGQQSNWSFTYGQSPYEHTGDDPTTPRHSSLFHLHSPPLPPDPNTGPSDEFHEPNDRVEVVLAPAVP